jgi:hypothetical protein
MYTELLLKIADFSDTINPATGVPYTFDEFYTELGNWVKNDEYVKAALKTGEGAIYSFRAQYDAWYNLMHPKVEEE